MAAREALVKRLVKLAASLCLRVCDAAYIAIAKLAGRTPAATCIVLYYHAVDARDRGFFARQMDTLLRHTQVISSGFEGTLVPGRRYTAITFDDGFLSTFQNALPELENRGLPAVLFVPSGCLGVDPPWIKDPTPLSPPQRVVSAEQLVRLKNHTLFSIGSHSVSHSNLLTLSQKRIQSELINSKRDLELVVGREVSLFSFPHGGQNSRLVRAAIEAGYSRVFTVVPNPVLNEFNQRAVGRIRVDPTDWSIEFYLKICGAYRWIAWLDCIRDFRKSLLLSWCHLNKQPEFKECDFP